MGYAAPATYSGVVSSIETKHHHHDHHHSGAATMTQAASSYTAPAPTMIAAPAVPYAAPAATASTYTAPALATIPAPSVQYVTFHGTQLPHFHDAHLRTLHPTKLREHANLLYSTVGHSTLGRAVP